MWYLWKEVMHHMRPYVMVDVVKHTIVTVDGGQTTAHVVPLLEYIKKRGGASGVKMNAFISCIHTVIK